MLHMRPALQSSSLEPMTVSAMVVEMTKVAAGASVRRRMVTNNKRNTGGGGRERADKARI